MHPNRPPQILLQAFFIVGLFLGLTACQGAPVAQPTATAVTTEPTAAAQVLNFYNWDTYMNPQILTDFEQKFGVKVNYKIYESDEDVLTELRSGPVDYDLVVPTEAILIIMRRENLLASLDKTNIPNLKNLDPAFLNPSFDPGNRHCLPYSWGSFGVGYNIEATGREIKSWTDVFDPAFAGRVAMYDDYRKALGVTLIYLGYSPNTTNRTEITEAAEFLKSHASQFAAYAADDGQDMLVSGQVDLALEWNGDIAQVMPDHPNIRFAVPEEGTLLWADGICIPATAPHQRLSEQFINYLLEPEVAAALSEYIQYATPNAAAKALLDEKMLNNPVIYPPAEMHDHLFSTVEIDAETEQFYKQAFDEVLADHNKRVAQAQK